MGANQPAFRLIRLVDPARRPGGLDLYVLDHYFIVDPISLPLNFAIFGGATFALISIWGALPPAKRAGA